MGGLSLQNVQVGKGFIAQMKINTWDCTVSLSFEAKKGVSQGCVMSLVLFNIAIDWVLRRPVEDQRRGIRWTPYSTLKDLDFADDVALLSHTRQHIQEKTDQLGMIECSIAPGVLDPPPSPSPSAYFSGNSQENQIKSNNLMSETYQRFVRVSF